MDFRSRDAFDAVLVAVALVLVYSHVAAAPDPASAVGRAVGAFASLDPVLYLVVLGLGGVLFLAYGLLYLPSRASEP